MSAKYQTIISTCFMFDVPHVKHKDIFLSENVAQVEFRRIISTSIVNYFGDQNLGIPRPTGNC